MGEMEPVYVDLAGLELECRNTKDPEACRIIKPYRK